MFEPGVLVSMALSLIGGVVWALRLEGKVKVGEQYTVDLKELIIAKLDGIDKRLSRIETSMNGRLRHDGHH